MRNLMALVGLMAAFAATAPAKAAISEPVRTDSGLLAGVPGKTDPSVTVFKGIPFAAPPVGDLRWKAPAPAIPWQGVRQADKFGPICPTPQGGGPPGRAPPVMSEDCLFLNLWTGAAKPNEKRPVFVWIYGGGFIGGAGSEPLFDGEGLARKGVIVVTFNYRVGALGFLATPELSQESGHNASGDYGIQDDIAALKWVRKNIAAFGGDPKRVTIGGQSAGAGSVGFLSMSPLAKGLFQQSIAESHARYPRDLELRYLSISYRPLKSAEQAGAKYAAALGAHSLAELRALPWKDVIAKSNVSDDDVYTGSLSKPPLFRPVVDGWVIPHTYSETYARGLQNDVPFIAGNNSDESGAYPETAFARLRAQAAPTRGGAPPANVSLANFTKAATMKFGGMTEAFLKLYPAANDDEAALQNNASVRDNSRVSTFLWGREWTKTVKKPIFTYFWTHGPPGPDHDMRGAYHASEINYVFNNLYATNRPWTDQDRKIADTMSSYWANYIKTGNPNGPGLPTWPVYNPKIARVMELGDHFGPIPVATRARTNFWSRFFQTQLPW